ncbi:LTV-domain-containing protein [Lentinus tigrinus ALCF2SS1-7]|uniref:LTV-domain-containing protein n=1 Tax=Lentinus tigrinus ALCF2SS1-7 TaxID=1328758 RepID=UPI001165F93B|nr:LTV-domain-containing protein [Lentinus tigrinus ALCF2SS1-7]
MPPKSIFRQPGAQHFQVVHRSQRDPLIHDPEANKHVLKPVVRGNLVKGKSRAELEQLLAPSDLAHDKQRANIGEAAAYGIYFDDTQYDYMQHLKPVGIQEDGVDSIWLEAPSKSKGKGKAKDPIELLDLPEGTLASKSELPRNYEAQQEIPSSIAGFQPDMDPHLRQVLEALEDDAFVDEGIEDNFFGELVADGERAVDEDFEYEFREEGIPDGEVEHVEGETGPADDEDESWEARFARYKREQKSGPQDEETSDLDAYSEGGDTIGTLPQLSVIGGKKRRRKGASDASGYSMSSSSMWRNEHLTVLDERFDQIQREYDSSDEEDEEPSLDDLDEAPDLIAAREDFDSMMDEFLEKYEVIAGKMRPTLPGSATEKLDTVRKALGEAKIRDAEESDSEGDDILMPLDVDEKKDRWDCETILTTYSNLENHPRLIRARNDKSVPKIRLDPKTGLPSVLEEQPSKKPAQADSSETDEDAEENTRPVRVTVSRSKDETPEEKKARKQAVKAERQARRSDKKATKEQFSKATRQQSQSLAQREKTKMKKL